MSIMSSIKRARHFTFRICATGHHVVIIIATSAALSAKVNEESSAQMPVPLVSLAEEEPPPAQSTNPDSSPAVDTSAQSDGPENDDTTGSQPDVADTSAVAQLTQPDTLDSSAVATPTQPDTPDNSAVANTTQPGGEDEEEAVPPPHVRLRSSITPLPGEQCELTASFDVFMIFKALQFNV